MSDNIDIIVQDTINDIIVNSSITVETIDIVVEASIEEVTIISNPNDYIININRVIGEQVQSDWDETQPNDPSYIKNKPTIPDAQVNSDWNATSGVAEILNKPTIPTQVTNTSELINDGADGVHPFITAQDIPAGQVNSDWNATSGVAEILNKPTIPAEQVNSDWNATTGKAQILNKPTIPSISGLATVTYVDTQDALKVDKVAGKGLSTNDFTNTLKTKLDGIQDGAEVNVNADWNAVSGDAQILNKPTIPAAQVNSDWNATSGVAQILNKPTIPDTSTFIPYTGATADVDLGLNNLYTNKLYLFDEVEGESGSIHYADEALHFSNSEDETLLWIEPGFMQIHKTPTIQSNLFTENLTTTRDHYLPDNSGTIALTSDITGTNSGVNTGDETTATIKSKLGITTLSGSNTGDQDLSGLVVKNNPITGATKTKITYDSKGLVTAGADATTSDIADSLNKRYVTDANLTTIGNQSGVNTGDETTATIKSKLGITTLSGSNTGDQDLSGLVPNTRTINTKALSSDVTLTTADISDSTNKRYVTDANLTTIGNQSGTNTGDNAVNSLYSGLAASKQDTLISGTNIKTINGNSVLGSGNLTISGGGGLQGIHSITKLVSGQSTNLSVNASSLAIIAGIANRLTLSPYIPAQTIITTNLYINVTTLLISSNARILIYSDLNGKPDTKIYESANLDCATLGIKTATTTQIFNAGSTYWIGLHSQSTPSYNGLSLANVLPLISTAGIQSHYFLTIAFGSAPTTFSGGSLNAATMPAIFITVA
jgi:hypothetical protein